MKKLITLLLLLSSFALTSQVSKNRMTTSPFYSWKNRQVPIPAYLDSTFSSFYSKTDSPVWSRNGDTVNVDTAFIGTRDNRDFTIKSNNKARFRFYENGTNEIFADTTTYTTAFIVNGGNTPNSSNAYIQLKGRYIGAYRILNEATGREWFMTNMTIPGSDLDFYSIGRSSNPALSFLKLDTVGHLALGTSVPGWATFRISQNHYGASSHGVYLQGTIKDDVSSHFYGFRTAPTFSNTTFTTNIYGGFISSLPGINAGNTIGTAFGFRSQDLNNAAINNAFGYYSEMSAGTNKWNFYGHGTAPSFMRGAVAISSVDISAPSASLEVRGTMSVSGTSTVNNLVVSTGSLTSPNNPLSLNTKNNSILFNTNDSLRFKIDSLGALTWTAPSSGYYNNFVVKRWESFPDIPAIYFGSQLTPTNYFAIADGYNTVINSPTVFIIRAGNQDRYSAGSTSGLVGGGSFNTMSGTHTPSLQATKQLTGLHVASYSVGYQSGTTPITSQFLVSPVTHSANTTATITEANGIRVQEPITGTGMTINRKWALKVEGSSNTTGSVVIGNATKTPSATLDVSGTMSVSGTSTLTNGLTITGNSGTYKEGSIYYDPALTGLTMRTNTGTAIWGNTFTNGTVNATYSPFNFTSGSPDRTGLWSGTESNHNMHLFVNGDGGGVPAVTINTMTPPRLLVNSTTYTNDAVFSVQQGGIDLVNGVTGAGDKLFRVGLWGELATNSVATIGSSVITSGQPTLNVSGTMSVSSTATLQNGSALGTATLAGGNSGTVAVLDDAIFTMSFQQAVTSTFNDGSTAYMSSMPISLGTSATSGTLLIPANCTLIGYTFNGYVAGTLASTENATLSIRVNNSTDFDLNNSVQFNTTDVSYNSLGFSNDYNVGDNIIPKFVFPTYATNPTNIYGSLILYFKRR